MRSFIASTCLLVAPWCIASNSGAPSPDAFDVAAERARREEIRRATRAQEDERRKRSGEPYLVNHVEARISSKPKTGTLDPVEVVIKVDEHGLIRGAFFPKQNDPLVERAVIDAVWQWRYSPRIVDGSPTRFETTVLVPVKRTREGRPDKPRKPLPTPPASPAGPEGRQP